MKTNTVKDCKIIDIKNKNTSSIDISSIVTKKFDVKRIYYLYDNNINRIRGEHAHLDLYQLIIGLNSGFKIKIDDGSNHKIINLNNSNFGLLIPPGIWRSLYDFKKDSVCLVFASEIYSENDYIRDYNEFKKYKK